MDLFITMALNLQESGDLVFVEVSIKPEICDIINMELEKEINYWKSKVSGDLKLLEEKAPKTRKLKSKEKTRKPVADIEDLLRELRSKYKDEDPQMHYLPMTPSKDLSFEEVTNTVKMYIKMVQKTDNFVLKNTYTLGSWLILAEKHFKHEKYLKRNPSLPKQFGQWIKTFGISRQSGDIYKNIFKLINKAPRLINCQISINLLKKNYSLLSEYFETKDSPWKHDRKCKCDICRSYFK